MSNSEKDARAISTVCTKCGGPGEPIGATGEFATASHCSACDVMFGWARPPVGLLASIIIQEALETPIDSKPLCLKTCTTKHRGCDPQCPKRWYEQGQDDERKRLIRLLEDA